MTPDSPTRATPGKFIVIDGPDVCGKGTQCSRLAAYLMSYPADKHKQFDVWHTREPWHSQQGKRIRVLLETAAAPTAELGKELTTLYIQDRIEHLRVILPMLDKGTHVLSDRYMYSTIAYQGAQGIPMDDLLLPQAMFRVPDLAIILLTSTEESIKRKAAARDRPYDEVFEKSHGFMEKVHANYARMAEMLPSHKLIYVDGNQERDAVYNDIKSRVDAVLGH